MYIFVFFTFRLLWPAAATTAAAEVKGAPTWFRRPTATATATEIQQFFAVRHIRQPDCGTTDAAAGQ